MYCCPVGESVASLLISCATSLSLSAVMSLRSASHMHRDRRGHSLSKRCAAAKMSECSRDTHTNMPTKASWLLVWITHCTQLLIVWISIGLADSHRHVTKDVQDCPLSNSLFTKLIARSSLSPRQEVATPILTQLHALMSKHAALLWVW